MSLLRQYFSRATQVVIAICILISFNSFSLKCSLLRAKSWSFLRKTSSYSFRSLQHYSSASDTDASIPVYNGPTSSLDEMIGGCSVENIGLTVLIGPSVTMKMSGLSGSGLYLALNEDTTDVSLPSGTVICGYSKGDFQANAEGDKCVAFAFCSTDVLVILNKKLISLAEAIQQLADSNKNDANFDLDFAVYGHLVERDIDGNKSYKIVPDSDFDEDRYFVPYSDEDSGIINMGMLANDLAYSPDILDEKQYLAASAEKNVVTLAWRLEIVNDRMLVPTWPVGTVETSLSLTISKRI